MLRHLELNLKRQLPRSALQISDDSECDVLQRAFNIFQPGAQL
jgi:hypothetical protein